MSITLENIPVFGNQSVFSITQQTYVRQSCARCDGMYFVQGLICKTSLQFYIALILLRQY